MIKNDIHWIVDFCIDLFKLLVITKRNENTQKLKVLQKEWATNQPKKRNKMHNLLRLNLLTKEPTNQPGWTSFLQENIMREVSTIYHILLFEFLFDVDINI